MSGIPHILPQGYQRGFECACSEGARDAKRLSVMNLSVPNGAGERFPIRTWVSRSPREVGKESSFYSAGSVPDADYTFRPKEEYISTLVREIRESNYWGWLRRKRRLVRYAQMLYLRSRLFREEYAASKGLSIEDIKEESIKAMLAELGHCPVPFARLKLQLVVARDCRQPFITCDCPVSMENTSPERLTKVEAVTDRFTYLIWPIAWDMCLIGSVDPALEGDVLGNMPQMVDYARKLISKGAREYLISPHALDPAQIELPPP
jgi:hypothetical protein